MTATNTITASRLARARRAAGLVVRHRRELWGIRGLRVSYVFFAVYASLAVASLARRPLIAGGAMAVAAIVEASDILPENRRRRRLSDWRRGLDVRVHWRTLLFFVALASGRVPYALVVAFGVFALGIGLVGRVMRSPALYLDSDRVLRPLGSIQAGAERLERARLLARRRDLSELPMHMAVGFAAFFLTLPSERPIAADSVIVAGTVIVAVAVGYAVLVAWQCRRLRPVLKLAHDDEVLAEFIATDPEVLCYFNGHRGSTYAVDVWLRTFEACGRRVALVYRHRDVRRVDTTTLPGIVARSDSMVEKLVTPSTRIALYPANGTLNIHLQRDPRLSHVFIGHGDSDKTGSASPFTRSYDQVWVSGQAAIDRYASAGVDIPPEHFVVIGRPPLSPRVRTLAIEHEAAKTDADDSAAPLVALRAELADRDRDETPPTILYAPTWEGYFDESDYSSLATIGVDLVTTILRELPGTRVIFKPHPLTGHRQRELGAVVGEIGALLAADATFHPPTSGHPRVHLYEWFDFADLLVTDVSSVVSDFLGWDRPCAVTNPRGLTPEALHDEFPTTAAAYVIDPDSPATAQVLRSALLHDPLRPKREQARTYFIGGQDEDPLDLFNRALDDLYGSTSSA